jgi:hypothetical protein
MMQVASSKDLDAEFAEMLKSFEVSPGLGIFSSRLHIRVRAKRPNITGLHVIELSPEYEACSKATFTSAMLKPLFLISSLSLMRHLKQ